MEAYLRHDSSRSIVFSLLSPSFGFFGLASSFLSALRFGFGRGLARASYGGREGTGSGGVSSISAGAGEVSSVGARAAFILFPSGCGTSCNQVREGPDPRRLCTPFKCRLRLE